MKKETNSNSANKFSKIIEENDIIDNVVGLLYM